MRLTALRLSIEGLRQSLTIYKKYHKNTRSFALKVSSLTCYDQAILSRFQSNTFKHSQSYGNLITQ